MDWQARNGQPRRRRPFVCLCCLLNGGRVVRLIVASESFFSALQASPANGRLASGTAVGEWERNLSRVGVARQVRAGRATSTAPVDQATENQIVPALVAS